MDKPPPQSKYDRLSPEEKEWLNRSVAKSIAEERVLRKGQDPLLVQPSKTLVAEKPRSTVRIEKSLLVIAVGMMIGGALFIWPTRYRYDHMEVGRGTSYSVRTDRITGRTEILHPEGWIAVKPQTEILNRTELAKLNTRANLEDSVFEDQSRWNMLCLDMHNESDIHVKEFTLEVNVFNSKKELVTDKRYRVTSSSPYYGSQPCATPETYRNDVANAKSREELTNNPNFYKLSEADQIQALSRLDPKFLKLPLTYQRDILRMRRNDLAIAFSTPLDLPPHGTGSFRTPLGFYVTEDQSWSFRLVDARGAED